MADLTHSRIHVCRLNVIYLSFNKPHVGSPQILMMAGRENKI